MVLIESQIKLKSGDSAPSFELMGTDETSHTLQSYKSQENEGLLIIFMCNHCPYVKAKIDAIKEIHQKFKGRVPVIGINSNDSTDYPEDSFEAMKEMVKEKGIAFDYLVDQTQEIAKKYGATCTPDPFLFNKDHKLVFHGRLDDAMKPQDTALEKTMIQNIEKLLAGQKIEKEFDPSIGCSIKWKEN